ncbi:endonuclease V protein [Acanthamoeba castellanii str. Neff]|uniref:Endonuclease V protein n=1 Tax=Acanthamoeba castellanii (strain ATCC 30010 / Neff) TaxID=1257118 RepID=L8GTH2_ACACF|nr:endonuclease V protein [Acanthamoeba castellanii str. Neff]ELR15421.1 endonuclease V protein [Acanthamoeba castellanii str. Neff]
MWQKKKNEERRTKKNKNKSEEEEEEVSDYWLVALVAVATMLMVVFVDGNGVLHPRGFGLASHLGVLIGIPTIGVGKTFFHVDGLDMREVKAQAAAACHKGGDWIPLIGQSGVEWGAAFRSTDGSSNPIYVSVGHRISLASAVLLTQASCLHRVPEPIRQADLRSREFLRKQGH